MQHVYRKHVLPVIGAEKISRIKPAKLKAIINDSAPGIARFTYTFLRPFFDWCLDREYITVSPIAEVKRPKKAEERDRVLKEDEMVALWHCADKVGYPFGPMYKLLLLTAQRRDEVSGMRWAELDFDKRIWTIPKSRTENSKDHIVHLSEQALTVLGEIERKDSPFVFTTTLTTPVSGYSRE